MELALQTDDNPWDAPGITLLANDVRDDDEFYMLAEEGFGTLLGRVTIIEGRPVLHTPPDLHRSCTSCEADEGIRDPDEDIMF